MSAHDHVVLSRDAARRVRDATRIVEAGHGTPGARVHNGPRNRVYVRIVSEVGSGEYTAEAIKRDALDWEVRDLDIFTDDSIPIYELNDIAGVSVGTVAEVFRFWDEADESFYWAFGAGGGGYNGPFKVEKNTSTSVKIGASRSASRPDLVVIGDMVGLQDTVKIATFTLPPPGPAVLKYIVYKIAQTAPGVIGAGTYTAGGLPTLSFGETHIILASILVDENGIVSIEQRHFGDVRVPMTIVEFPTVAPFDLTFRPQTPYSTVITTAEECAP